MSDIDNTNPVQNDDESNIWDFLREDEPEAEIPTETYEVADTVTDDEINWEEFFAEDEPEAEPKPEPVFTRKYLSTTTRLRYYADTGLFWFIWCYASIYHGLSANELSVTVDTTDGWKVSVFDKWDKRYTLQTTSTAGTLWFVFKWVVAIIVTVIVLLGLISLSIYVSQLISQAVQNIHWPQIQISIK